MTKETQTTPEPRFFIDHGMIHDRLTGKHVTTAPNDETWNGGTVLNCLALLNELNDEIDVAEKRGYQKGASDNYGVPV